MIARIAPYLLAAALALAGTSLFTAKGWWHEYKSRLETERNLELAQAATDNANESARRLHAQQAAAQSELANVKAQLSDIPATDCFDGAMPDAAIRLLNKARGNTAAAASSRPD